jgi:hypothetical protein
MGKKILTLSLVILFFVIQFALSQSKETGAIQGYISDEEGAPLPGVTVTLTSPNMIGVRTAVTDSEGYFRFPALPPGLFEIKAELPGFTTVVQKNIRLHTTETLTIDLTMRPTAIEEEITVIGKAPTIDVKSTETASVTLTDELLRNVPYSQFTVHIVELAPAVFNRTAYGASSSTGIAWQVDGVDVSDPEGGTAWVFLDHNIVEEAKIMGVGLPAEYGAFTGVIFNLITKSGGNEFSGHFEFDYQGKKDEWPKGFWQTENNQKYIDDFPKLTSPLQKLLDANAHIGGPIKKDKVWFYLGAQWYRSWRYPTGFPEAVDYKQPRAFVKITAQATPSTNINTFFEYDAYDGINRGARANVSPEATVTQDSPDYTGNFSLTHIFSPKTFMDFKVAFFTGYYYLDPEVGKDISGHFDLAKNWLHTSAGWFYYADRARYQANMSVTHYAEDFIKGDHDFKFGVEFEHGRVRNRFGYTGPNHMFYLDFYGPYLAYQYEGYDTNTRYTRVEGFAQDAWKISDRLNLNLGVRFSQMYGTIKDVEGTVYKTFRIAPRIGFTFDIFGDHTTVFKAHYGQYTEGMYAAIHSDLNPPEAFSDFVGYWWSGTQWVEWFRIKYEQLYEMADDIKHPYMDQFTLSIERELFTDASLTLSFIYRKWHNIIGRIDTLAQYEKTTVYDPETGVPYTAYNQTNVGQHHYVIDNLEKGLPWILDDAYRKYWGIEILFNKRFSNKWQLVASYVYGEATGTIDNYAYDDIGYSGYGRRRPWDPNYWLNAEGHCSNDPTHMLKIQGTYILPFDIAFTAYFRAITGRAWTRTYRVRLAQGYRDIFTEPRGSHHYPMQKILDIRLEKIFTLAEKYRLGIIFDVFNVFNDDTILRWGTRVGAGADWKPGQWPSTNGHYLYSIVRPRQARVGIRLMF